MEAKSQIFLTDTHAHLASPRFAGSIEALLDRASDNGVGRIVTISCDEADSRANLTLASAFPGVFPTVGVHPCYVHETGEGDWFDRIRTLAEEPGVVAIGEIGLDFHHPPQDGGSLEAWRRKQRVVFEKMLQLALDLRLPAVIHQRECGAAVMEVMRNFPGVVAVLHCFTGTPAEAEDALACGHFLSFTGVLTYPKATEVRESATIVPLDRVMVETDSPYLAPVPFRGKTCEPSMIRHTAQRLAELHGSSADEIAVITSRNAERFFRLSGPLLGPDHAGTALALDPQA